MTGSTFGVVTGASSGIGLELARQLVEHGFDVLICAEDAELGDAAEDLRTSGREVQAVRADLSTADGVEQLLAAVRATGRPVDALVLNAGVANAGPFLQTPLEDDLGVVGLNVSAVVHLAKRLLPGMVARGEGRVLVTSSTAAEMPGPYYATYAASKAFGLSFAEAVRYELKDSGVTVTVLQPGPTDTEFFASSHQGDAPVAKGPKDDPAKVARRGYKAMMKGKRKVVVRSVKARSQTAMAKVLPDKAKAAVHGAMTRPTGD